MNFAVQSAIDLFRDGELMAHWEEGQRPESGFYEIVNTEVVRWEIINERLILFEFVNGIEMHMKMIPIGTKACRSDSMTVHLSR